ncbi:MAG: NAD(P)/FAD-dependent oxidoreductase [Proteobacteria bacterium]|nr:NAD(P)/FAD-dependent oxidoreductase [Pseudomonadota bacterium]
MSDAEVVVVGAGVVGMACAARLAAAGRSVVTLERHAGPGSETSSRNSGVIHAGLYYPPGSLKARTCVEGRKLLYERAQRLGIAHRRIGKLVLATCAMEQQVLNRICARGIENGAGALRVIDTAEIARLEPRVRALAALWSPETGIVDAHALVDSYRREAQDHGGQLALRTHVVGLARCSGSWRVRTRSSNGDVFTLDADFVVNAAGLDADRVASLAGIDVAMAGYRQHPCKGDYFAVRMPGGSVRHLIYPVPGRHSLGIHLTLDLQGRLRAGPDVHYVADIGYDVDPSKAAAFGDALRRYLPSVRDEDLSPDYAGIRPKLQGPEDAARDFVLEEASGHGAPRLINLVGIESPGLTAAEALAARVEALVRGH